MSEKQSAQESPIPRDMLAKERTAQALYLRRMGFTYAEIAERAGYAEESGARKAVKKALNTLVHTEAQELAAHLIQLQLDRLDFALSRAIMPKVEKGTEQLWAVDRLVLVLKHQAELLGLYPKEATSGEPFESIITNADINQITGKNILSNGSGPYTPSLTSTGNNN